MNPCPKCYSATMIEHYPDTGPVRTCRACGNREPLVGLSVFPYEINEPADFQRLLEANCKTCDLYQESRPDCRFISDYHRGTFSGPIHPRCWVWVDGSPVCSKHTPRPEIATHLAPAKIATETPKAPSPESLNTIKSYRLASGQIVALGAQEIPGEGAKVLEPDEIKKYLLENIYLF